MIDYSIAGRWANFVHALAITESNENENAVGDGGQARGLLQQHPSFFKRYYGLATDFPMDNDDTWTMAHIKATASFLEIHSNHLGLDLAIQAYNKGVDAVMKNGARNPHYLERFTVALNKIRTNAET